MASSTTKVIRRIVHSSKTPPAIGPYSQAVVVDRTIYLSGQIGIEPQTGKLVGPGVREQMIQVLANMGHVLEAADSSLKNVVKTTLLLADINDFQAVNEIYGQYFTEKQPARATYQVAALPKGAKVEVEAVAISGELEDI